MTEPRVEHCLGCSGSVDVAVLDQRMDCPGLAEPTEPAGALDAIEEAAKLADHMSIDGGPDWARGARWAAAHFRGEVSAPPAAPSEPRADSEGLDAAWAEARAALPGETCDLSVYHYDDGPPVSEEGPFGWYAPHKEPAKYAAKTMVYPTGVEVYGYGLSPAAALLDLARALRREQPAAEQDREP